MFWHANDVYSCMHQQKKIFESIKLLQVFKLKVANTYLMFSIFYFVYSMRTVS